MHENYSKNVGNLNIVMIYKIKIKMEILLNESKIIYLVIIEFYFVVLTETETHPLFDIVEVYCVYFVL